jgi:tetratricopeptide (TPR) repeat protein
VSSALAETLHTGSTTAAVQNQPSTDIASKNEPSKNPTTSEATLAPVDRDLSRSIDPSITIQNHRYAIEQKQSELGPYDPALSEMVFSLGKTLQINQRYDEAVAAYKRSLHLKRINNGIYSLSQEPMLRGVIEIHNKQGLKTEVSENYDQLLWLYLKAYGSDDVRLIPLLDEISQWHLNTYAQTALRQDGYHLSAALDLYTRAIELSAQHQGPFNLKQIKLLRNLAITSYYYASHQQRYPVSSDIGAPVPFGYRAFGPTGDDMLRQGSHYLQGRSAHNRILDILDNNPDVTPIDKAIAQADLGDWFLLFGRYSLALGAYEQAHKIMAGDKHQSEVLAALFGTPTMLPTLDVSNAIEETSPSVPESHPNTIENSHAAAIDNYVNLSVDVSTKGAASNLQVQEIHPEGISEYGSRAQQTIRARKFRPRFVDGEPVPTTAVLIKVLIPHENS